MPNTKHKQKGVVALVSLLIIAAISLIVVVGASDNTVSQSYQVLNATNSLDTYYMAEGCFEEAMIQLEADPEFSAMALSFDTDQSCSLTVSGEDPLEVEIAVTNGSFQETFTADVEFTTDGEVNNFELLQWRES